MIRLTLATIAVLPSIALAFPGGAPSKASPPAATAPAAPAASAPAAATPVAPAAKAAGEAPRVAADRPLAVVKIPLLSEAAASVPAAQVGDELIRVNEVLSALARTHSERGGKKGMGGDYAPVLDRLIETRLVALEARAMGLDEEDDFATNVKEYEEGALRTALKETVIRTVEADALEVEAQYREATRAWKVRALKFEKEADAKAARGLVEGGKTFEDVAKALVAEKKATDDGKAEVLPASKALPEVVAALTATKAGAVSAPVAVEGGFALLKVEELTHVEDPAIKSELLSAAISARQAAAVRAYDQKLAKKWATTDRKLFERLDFEAKVPGFAALAKDKRALVRIKGEKPITVADLAAEITKDFYHGVDGPIRDKKVNEKKYKTLEDMVARRLFLLEARAQHLDESEGYKLEVAEFVNGLLFGRFVEKVIVPEVKLTEGDGQAYYEQHKAEFTFPAFYKVEAIAFRAAKPAQAALAKLDAGTDLKWVRGNADGVIPADESTLAVTGMPLNASTMPPDLAKLLSGTKAGDRRIYVFQGQHHVIQVVDVTPSTVQEYRAAREAIARKLFGEAVQKNIKTWVGKLREAHPVTVFLAEIQK